MNEIQISVLISSLISLSVTLIITPKFISFFKRINATGYDINKKEKIEVAEIGGIPTLIGFIFGISTYMAIQTFLFNSTSYIDMLGASLTITLIVLVGFLEDLTILEKGSKHKKVGFGQIYKILLPVIPAIPLMAINVGVSVINIPLFGYVNLGLLYPLIMVPVAIIGASNATNLLAGLNGLESGLGIITLSSLGLYAYIHHEINAFAIATIFVFALIGFWFFNKYPSKMFPGDSLTYSIGAVIATVAILGNMEKFAVMIFLLWFIEFFLKLKSKFRAESFGVIQKDGTLKSKYKKNYSLTHIIMNSGNFTEKEIVYIIYGIQIIICFIAFILSL